MQLKRLFETVGEDIDNGNVKDGLIKIFDFISYANKYFDEKEPWKLAKENIEECNNVLLNCVNIILNVNTLLKPYLPFSCENVEGYLNEKVETWDYTQINSIEISKEIKPLYERYDKSRIEEEKERLKNTI